MAASSIYRSKAGETAITAKYGDLLRHWPIEKESRDINTRHGKTHVIICGNANNPPLLLLHGTSDCAIRWLNDVETFCRSHQVYVIELLGEPNRSENTRPKMQGAVGLEWMEDIFTELKLKQAALVGENIGAWHCLQFACAYPEKINHLALLSPAGIADTRWRYRIRAMAAFLLGPLGKSLLMGRIARGADIDQKFSDYYRLVRKHFKPRSNNLPKIRDKPLSQLYCPILLMVGKKDIVFSARKVLLRLVKKIPQLEVNFRSGDGHCLTTCTREIDRFLVTEYPTD